jgi:hypothetical protein
MRVDTLDGDAGLRTERLSGRQPEGVAAASSECAERYEIDDRAEDDRGACQMRHRPRHSLLLAA